MSTRKLTEAERRAVRKQREDFFADILTGRAPARKKWKKHEREEALQQFKAEINAFEKQGSFDPCATFLQLRMNELTLQHGSGNTKALVLRAHLDLLASDVPLDLGTRRSLADRLARALWPDPKRTAHQLLLEARSYQDLWEYGVGLPTAKAEKYIADLLGLSVEALRKRRERARKQKQRRPRAGKHLDSFPKSV